MKHMKNKSGFTLLEIIIVIIIIGVLASLALPRFFRTVEFSRSSEALQMLSALRGAVERCGMQNGQSFTGCTAVTGLDVDVPADANSHFDYTIVAGAATSGLYTITATRDSDLDANSAATNDTIILTRASDGSVTRVGSGEYAGIK